MTDKTAAAGPEQDEARPNRSMPADSIDELIERWFADHFHGSEVARHTPAWNVAMHAKEALKLLLKRST